MQVVSVDAGEVRRAEGGDVDGSGRLGSSQCNPPVLPGQLEQCFDDRRRNRLLLGTQKMPEVGRAVRCPLVQLEGAGELLVAW